MHRIRTLTALLALTACACAPGAVPEGDEEDEDRDGSGDTAQFRPECEPTGITLTQVFDRNELPDRESLEHAEPGVGLGDLDGDGDLDALIAWPGGSFGLRNDGAATLALDETIDFNGGEWPGGTGVALADLDGDGDLDGYLGHRDATDTILWNDGAAHFTEQALSGGEPGSASWTGSFADMDNDGDLDLYVAARVPDILPRDVLAGTQIGLPNYIYRNDGGVFTRDDTRLPQQDNYGLTFQGAWVDVEPDGDLDLYEANDWGVYVTPNRLLLNDGTGRFSAAEDCFCDLAIAGMGVAVGDYQGDALPDLYVTDIGSPNLLTNAGDGSFADSTLAVGAYIPPGEFNLTSWGASFADLDRNGCSDLVVVHGRIGSDLDDVLDSVLGGAEGLTDPELQSNVALLNDCGQFTRLASTHFDAFPDRDRAIALGDLDGDGRTDMVTAGKNYIRVWKTTGGCDQGLLVRLHQPGHDPSGIGSRVQVTANGRTQTQWMLPSTLHSSSAEELNFGLGSATEAQVEVLWPDGTITHAGRLEAGTVRIER